MAPRRTIEPMRATVAAARPDPDDAWAYEVKWDGYRIVAFVEDGAVRLQTRNLLDATDDFPSVQGLAAALGPIDVVFDGEIVALDADGRPSFGALQQRGHRPTAVQYVIFDVLEVAGTATFSLPYVERRRLLEQLDLGSGPAWQVPRYTVGDGDAMLAATRAAGLEGLIAKRLDSTYEPGRRSRAWLKLKHWAGQELVVGGWLPGKGVRSGGIGSLLVGHFDDAGELHYAGRVGTGLTDAELGRLAALLAPLARDTSPFTATAALPVEVRRLGHFVEPEAVVEVAFSEWTHNGTIRQPSYKGLRTDKPARAVRRDA
jgi:bifunctional non-homologous end joining protein LigD